MKYRELIQFEPLNEVVKFNRLDEPDYRQNMVSSYVFSKTYEQTFIPNICRQLDYTASHETFGLQIVGTYGTGKSHLMSLFSLIAEDADYLPYVKSDSAKQVLKNIAGKYRVVRFELGAKEELWNLVCYQIDQCLNAWGVDYSISADRTPDMYKDKLHRMMAHFEEAYPDKGLMIVIDEMLSYLQGRSGNDRLNSDLAVLQALGEMSDHSKFRMVFGVQELIYQVPEFQFAANMLSKVNQRYQEIKITKQDVKFVTQQRILRKTSEQKALICKHLEKFTHLFTPMHAHLEEYVDLFPVNPSFFDNFEQINIAKSQREILKTLSRKFAEIADSEVPTDQPGLIGYDSYWNDLQNPSMQIYGDIRRVTEIMQTIEQKIDENFIGGRATSAPLAHRIAKACAVKILQNSLTRANGVSAEMLVDDLCYVDPITPDREFLIDIVASTAQLIVTATDGQYFDKNKTNQEYHIRVEGGVNYEQKIRDFLSTMSPSNKDSYFYGFLVKHLPIEVAQYRTSFRIYKHSIHWTSHKVKLDGYIFMGTPTERSTTHPEQYFYIYFMPIFDDANKQRGDEADSVYFSMDGVSDEMKELIGLYAASEALTANADSSQKEYYQKRANKYYDQLREVFDRNFLTCTEVYYKGEKQHITPEMLRGDSKEQVVSNIASYVLEQHFCERLPDFPQFTLLNVPLTDANCAIVLKSARQKIADPNRPNQQGEAILCGLGLLADNQLSTVGSIYAQSVKQRLEEKGEGQVLNRDEILRQFYKDWDGDWRSIDFHLPADLQFIVLAAMVAVGEIEIEFHGGKNIKATNLNETIDFNGDAFYNFSHVRPPRMVNIAAVRELFLGIVGKDMTHCLQDKAIYDSLLDEARKLSGRAVNSIHDLEKGLQIQGIQLIAPNEVNQAKIDLAALAGLCDKIPHYASPARIRNLKSEWTAKVLKESFAAKKWIVRVEDALQLIDKLRGRLDYLQQALQYMTLKEMKQQTETAIGKFVSMVGLNVSDPQVVAYVNELDSVKERYIAWYLKEYSRLHINEFQAREKQHIVNGEKYQICNMVSNADHDCQYLAVSERFTAWSQQMSQLTTGDQRVGQDYLTHTPSANFNPMHFVGKSLPQLNELREELEEIYGRIDEGMHTLLTDKELLKNRDVLSADQQALLDRFNSHSEELTPNNAKRLYELLGKLHQKVHHIKLTSSQLRTIFNKSMTPDDAIKAFKQYIQNATKDYDNENTRITFKE